MGHKNNNSGLKTNINGKKVSDRERDQRRRLPSPPAKIQAEPRSPAPPVCVCVCVCIRVGVCVCARARMCVSFSYRGCAYSHIKCFCLIFFYTRMCCARSSAGKPLTSILSIDTNTSPGRTLPHCSAGLSRILKNKIDVDF